MQRRVLAIRVVVMMVRLGMFRNDVGPLAFGRYRRVTLQNLILFISSLLQVFSASIV